MFLAKENMPLHKAPALHSLIQETFLNLCPNYRNALVVKDKLESLSQDIDIKQANIISGAKLISISFDESTDSGNVSNIYRSVLDMYIKGKFK